MSYLDSKVLIYVKSENGEKRFFNRKTQGFTARLRYPDSELSFFDTRSDKSLNPYFNSFRQHKESESIWQAMAENDSTLKYCKTTVANLRKKSGIL